LAIVADSDRFYRSSTIELDGDRAPKTVMLEYRSLPPGKYEVTAVSFHAYAHLAESYNIAVCPHFLMELHVALCCAVPNARWVEYIPQLDSLTKTGMTICDGYALPSADPGLGIAWDFAALKQQEAEGSYRLIKG